MKNKKNYNTEISIVLIAPFGKEGGVTKYAETLYTQFQKVNVPVTKISTHINKNKVIKPIIQPIKIAYVLLKKRRVYNLISVQLASYWGFMPGIVSVIMAKILNKKVVATYHGGEYSKFIKKHGLIFKFVLKNSDFFIVSAKIMRDCVINTFSKIKNKITVIPTPYNDELFKYIEQKKAREILDINDRKILLNVANLYHVKGHTYLLKSINKSIKKYPDIICYIIGEGPERPNLEKMIKDMNLEEHVILAGKKPHEHIPLWINASNICILSSLKEGNPNVMLELLACGKPFIGTAVGGIRDVINDNVGIVVPPENSDVLSKAIIKAVEIDWNTEYILNYSKQFSSENVIRQIIEVCSKVFDKT